MKKLRLLCAVMGWGAGIRCVRCGTGKRELHPVSSTARSITGDVNFSNEKLMISFSTFPIAQIAPCSRPRSLQPSICDETSGVSGNLFGLSIPGSRRFLHKNTLCGADGRAVDDHPPCRIPACRSPSSPVKRFQS